MVRRSLIATAIAGGLVAPFAYAAPMLSAGGHRPIAPNAWIEVNLGAFERNLSYIQQLLANGAKLCAIMKADAYGMGIETLMPTLLKAGVPCVGITSTEEARVVRASGFTGQLMRVRAAAPDEVEEALTYDVEELVGNAELARKISEIARRRRQVVSVHLALNSSGISRNGLDLKSSSGKEDAMAIIQVQGLRVVGVMTHFAVEDRPDVLRSLDAFKRDCEWLFANTNLARSDVTLHAANSFATLNVPESHLDMVRTGAAMYGHIGPFDQIAAFKSRVAAVNVYPAGRHVGYDRTYTLKRDSMVANITVGYSDGYLRAFTNRGSVLVRGQRAPVIGKVSMNTLMVDVTNISGVRPGDEVVLFGKQGSHEITQAEIEEAAGVGLVDLSVTWGNANPKIAQQ
ncbi:alanine racemase [Burkholderia ubonensis]|nr:alanine racemase [Burkholderia ubonensis]